MEKNKFWIIIGLIVIFAFAMEMVKDKDSTISFRRIHKSDADINEMGTFTNTDREHHSDEDLDMPEVERIEASGMSIAGLQVSKTEDTAPAGDAAATPDKGKEKKDAKKDDKKKDDKKKKKKKKGDKTAEAKGPAFDVGVVGTDANKPSQQTNQENANAYNRPAPAVPMKNAAQPQNEPVKGLREWEEILLNHGPNYEATQQFIRAYQAGEISADIFYTVVSGMLQHQRDERIRRLGVMALGSTPSLKSFSTLVYVVEGETTSQSPVRIDALNYLETYRELHYLKFIAQAIQNSSPVVAMKALKILKTSADNNLRKYSQLGKNGGLTTTPGQPQNPQQSALLTQVNSTRKYFTTFVSILNKVTKTFQTPDLRETARVTLASLQQYLSTIPQPNQLQPNPLNPLTPPTQVSQLPLQPADAQHVAEF